MKNEILPDSAIEIKGLSKEYKGVGGTGNLLALDSIDLNIPRGSMFGLLGPNGAGKSTFINILAGLTLKTSGKAIVWGFDLDKNPRSVRASLGVVPQEIYVDPFFSPRETLNQQAGMYGVMPKDRNVDFLLKTLDPVLGSKYLLYWDSNPTIPISSTFVKPTIWPNKFSSG